MVRRRLVDDPDRKTRTQVGTIKSWSEVGANPTEVGTNPGAEVGANPSGSEVGANPSGSELVPTKLACQKVGANL